MGTINILKHVESQRDFKALSSQDDFLLAFMSMLLLCLHFQAPSGAVLLTFS